jgi:hypothetical protein
MRYAFRNIRVTNGEIGPAYDALIVQINKAAEELAPQLLGISGENKDWLDAQTLVTQNAVDLRLTIALPDDARPAARQFADTIVASLKDFVRHDFERQRDERLEPLADAKAMADHRLREFEKSAAELRDKMRVASGRADVSAKNVSEALTRLEEEKQKVELEMMGKKARRAALEEQLAKQSDTVEKRINDDAIAAELEKVVKIRQEAMDRLKKLHDSGNVSNTEVNEAVSAAAEARAKLLERRRDAAAEAGGDALQAFNRELLNLSIEQRELEARLDYIARHLPGLREASDLAGDLDRAESDVASARVELRETDAKLRDFALRTTRSPQFSVMESVNRETKPEESQSLFGGGGGGGGNRRR